MGKTKRINKSIRLLFIILASAMLIATGYVGINYYQKQSNVIPFYKTLMHSKALEYTQKINNYFNNLENKAVQISTLQAVETILEETKNNQISTDQTNLRSQKLKKNLIEFSSEIAPAAFKNFLLATAEGKIIFSLHQSKYVGITFSQTQTENNELAYSFQRSYMCLAPDISAFYFDEIIQEPALYITVPIFKKGSILGFLFAQVDQNSIYQITQNYLGLGKTGEFVIGKHISTGAQIIAPTRLSPNIAFKETGLYKSNVEIPLQFAVLAGKGTSIAKDYRNTPVIASWNYIPNANWGLVAKIDYNEVINMHKDMKNSIYFMLIISLMLWCALALSIQSIRTKAIISLKKIINTIFVRRFFIRMSLALFILSVFLGGYIYLTMIRAHTIALEQAQTSAQIKGTEAVKEIEDSLEKFSLLVQGVASSLSSGRLLEENITTNVKRKLNEELQLFGFCIAYKQTETNQTPFAPYIIRKSNSIEITDLNTVLKTQKLNQNFNTLPWFDEVMKQKKSVWMQPSEELITNKLVIIYAEPFFAPSDTEHKEPIGAVSAMYDLNSIIPMLRNLSIGETGYPFIVNEKGKFIFHPIETYQNNTTIFSEAQKKGNLVLNTIDTNIVQGKKGLESYEDTVTNQTMWIAYQPISIIKWSLAIEFAEQEITPPFQQLHHLMIWLTLCTIIALLCLCILLSALSTRKPLRTLSIASSFVFTLGIIIIWGLVQPNVEVKNGIVVTTSIGLDTYVNELKKNAYQRHDPAPITLPTGIFLQSWKIADATQIDISGTVWQKYNNKNHQDLSQEIDFPDATSVIKTDKYENELNQETTVGWNLTASIAQQFDYSKYPLDSQHIHIMMSHKDLEKNIVLIPDLSSYTSIRPTDLPGLDKQFIFYGFNIQKSFFSLEKTKEDTDYGISAYNALSEHIKLNYNIIITRDLLNALIVYFLPLLVVLFSLFAIFAVTGHIGTGGSSKKIFVSLTGYTGLLFVLITLHHVLRGQYPAGNVLYIEYFFFYTYVTILILIVHGAIVQAQVYENLIQNKITPIMRMAFWPLQMAIWFITTVIVFYN